MRLAILLSTVALAGCVGQPCEWDDPRWGGSCFITEGQGDGPASPADPAPEAAPEPPEPAAAPVAAPEPEPAPAARPEPVTPASVPDPIGAEPEPEPVDPEPEKPDYADYANPGDDALFEGFSPEEVAMKQMDLAARRAEAEAAHQAEFGGEKSGGSER